jgi:hypothetical protein
MFVQGVGKIMGVGIPVLFTPVFVSGMQHILYVI